MSDMASDQGRRDRDEARKKLPKPPPPAEWAGAMSTRELFERLLGYCDAELPRAVATELKRRYNAKVYGRKP